ncbi:MAG: glycosyltransferase family 4 protein [Candidatus Vogelbacteria bacterium]|nr:glycosyltransferase family 4 protein [Candidatus Vogelbacteria bacterium]
MADYLSTENNGILVVNKPKKLLVVTAAYPPEWGGQATYARLLKDGLPKVSKDKLRAIIFNGRCYLNWPRFFRFWAVFLRTLYLGRYCDAIYALDIELGRGTSVAAAILRKPFWLKLDATAVWAADHQVKPFLPLINRSSLVIAPSREIFDLVRSVGIPETKLLLLSNAFDAPEGLDSRVAIRTKWKVQGEIAVAAGPLSLRKNFRALIEIWPAVLERFPDAKLLIFGDGPERKNLENAISELTLKDSVLLSPALSGEELYVYLKMSNVVILPSFYEASSQFLREARSLGASIIAGAIGDNREVLAGHQAASFVDPNDRPALLAAILKMIAEPTEAVLAKKTSTEEEMLVTLSRRLIAPI